MVVDETLWCASDECGFVHEFVRGHCQDTLPRRKTAHLFRLPACSVNGPLPRVHSDCTLRPAPFGTHASHSWESGHRLWVHDFGGVFGALGLDALHGFFEYQGIAVDCLLVRETQLAVDFVPVLGVCGLVGLGVPVWNVAFYEGEPELGIFAAELGGGFFEEALR